MPVVIFKRDATSESNGIEPVWMTVAILLPILLSAFLLYFCYRCYRADLEFRVRGVVTPSYCQRIPESGDLYLLTCPMIL